MLPETLWLVSRKGPCRFCIHGDGFAIGSKKSHRLVGRKFAARGHLTFVINYRPSPRHPYPASIEDFCQALCWVWDRLDRFDGDKHRRSATERTADLA